MSAPPEQDAAVLELALRLARAAGALQRERYETVLDIGTKSAPVDLVTEVDRACEQLVVGELARLRPGELPSALYALAVGMAAKEGFADGFMGLGDNKVRFLGHGIGLTIEDRLTPDLQRLQAGFCCRCRCLLFFPAFVDLTDRLILFFDALITGIADSCLGQLRMIQ